MQRLTHAVIAFLMLCSVPAFTDEEYNPQLHVEIMSLSEASAPRVFGDDILFTFAPEGRTRFVGASFAHEDYLDIHDFFVNENGIFILVYPIPESDTLEELRYRLVVDGLWMPDPENPMQLRDGSGIRLSVFALPESDRELQSPVISPEGRVTFHFRSEPGSDVYLAGSFNNWDPFMHKLRETSPGFYQLTIRVAAGRHFYHFIDNGDRTVDPLNTRRVLNPNGAFVSVLELGPRLSSR